MPPLPPRPSDGHKGTFGAVCVAGGLCSEDQQMIGGPALSALAALRAGCGLAKLAMPRPVLAAGLTIAPSATGIALPQDDGGSLLASQCAAILDEHLSGVDCLAIGPGFGTESPQEQIVARLIADDGLPLVIDADAINALAAMPDFHRDFRAAAVLTPHPGEYRRLASALSIDLDPVDPDTRPAAAEALAQRLGCVVILKGHLSVITDGATTSINSTGNSALATAGSGDVLTGIVAGLIAQFFKRNVGVGERQIGAAAQGGLSLLDCARIAAHIHGAAAERWVATTGSPAGMMATDLIEQIPAALAALPRTP